MQKNNHFIHFNLKFLFWIDTITEKKDPNKARFLKHLEKFSQVSKRDGMFNIFQATLELIVFVSLGGE